MKPRILSGMRPTGKLHIGHFFGALQNWIKLQDKYDCFYMIADWHALMSEYENPSAIQEDIFNMAADWMSCGLNPRKSTLFIQSHVPEHLELAMIFGVLMPLTLLERCPTYKEQLRETSGRQLTTYGFLGYPVLQAADILIYKANSVPIGVDQLPHLEITRQIVRRFNNMYKGKLIEPKPLLTEVPKLLGTDNRKMSKSYGNAIELQDPPAVIKKKVMAMITDPKRIKLKDPGHPETCNVFSYYKIFKPGYASTVERYCKGATVGCTECKERLAKVLAEYLAPIQKRRKALLRDKGKIESSLARGTEKASKVAKATLKDVKRLVGMA